MESDKGENVDKVGAEAKNGDANSQDAESKAGAPAAVVKDLTKGVEVNADENPEESKGDDAVAGGAGSSSKEDQSNAEGETGNGSPENPVEDGSQQSQNGSSTSGKVDDKKATSETKTVIGDDLNAIAKQSSVEPSSSSPEATITKKEEIDDEPKEIEKVVEEKEEDIAEHNPEDGISKNKGNNVTDDEAKGLLVDEAKVVEDAPLEEQEKTTVVETEKSTIANEIQIMKKEGETVLGDQHSKSATESEEERKAVVTTETGPNSDISLHTTEDKSMKGKEEDEKSLIGLQPTIVESKENGESSNEKDDSSTKIPMVLDQSNIADEDDAYENFQKKVSSKRKKAKKRRSIKIKISGMSTGVPKAKSSSFSKMTDVDSSVVPISHLIPNDLDVEEKELEDSLEFFEQPHEDQDPTYTEFINKEQRDRIKLALNNLRIEEESGKKQIGLIVNQQLKDKQGSTEKYIEKHKVKMTTDMKNESTRLQQTYSAKARSNKGKIDHGIAVLRKKHSEETQKYRQQHRQQAQQRRLPEQMASGEWAQINQRLNVKHQRQMHDFTRKGKEVMNKCKVEFERERTRLTKIHEKRLQELNTQRQNLYSRIYSTLQQIRQRHLKRHVQSIAERRKAMESELVSIQNEQTPEAVHGTDTNKEVSNDKVKGDTEERMDRKPVEPIKTATDWRNESVHEPSGAATRHKHRKGVLSQISRELSVEIHNEGIWLSKMSEKKPGQNRGKDSSDSAAKTEGDEKHFFPWGVKARKVLESIVCGEIPSTCDALKFNFSETSAQNGGHIRCVMTDLRTSDGTASSQRAEAIMKKEVDELKKMEEREAAIKKNMVEMEKNMDLIKKQHRDLGLKLKETLKDYENTKQHLQTFRTKYAGFFGPDGKPLPTNDPNDTRKLTQHGLKYKMAIESSEKRGLAIKGKIAELHASLQKRQTNHATGKRAIVNLNAAIKSRRTVIGEVRSGRLNLLQTKSAANPTTRVKDTIQILGLTADMRRDQLNQKRNGNTSSHWVQSLPGVPGSLRRSLWYKMHRRRQQIVLRPTFSSMLTNMRNEIESKLTSVETGIRRVPKGAIEDKLIKAEQTYLLVTHPVGKMNENLSSLPSSSAWAEPGWHLKLEVNREENLDDMILPCPPRQPLVQHNLSELYSAPGRQAASMVNSTHLRSLETPLSAVATATSLSETDPAMAKSADPILSSNDPLKMTRDALKLGYAFSVNKTQAVRPTVTRRKSSTTKDTTTSVSTKVVKKKQSSTTPTDSSVSKPHVAPVTLNTTRVDNSRKRKSTTSQPDSTSTPRAVQRKRSEPPRQQIPVDDQAFQPRPIMTQPQQQQQPAQSSAPFMQQAMPQQQQNPYSNQFINTMPSPVAPQQQAGHRGSFNQFQNAPQMNQFRMMQQQQTHHQQQHRQQHSNQQKVNYGQMQQQPMRPNPQFFPQMGQQQFPQQPMQMPGQGGMQMNMQGNNQVRQNMATSDEQNDPLFMLKDM